MVYFYSGTDSLCNCQRPPGICDDDIAMCYCPPGTKYGHIPAPEGSPPGTLPVQIGRPLYNCNPKEVRSDQKEDTQVLLL